MENWKSIEFYEGKYQVSDKGRVRALPRTIKRRQNGRVIEQFFRGRILKQGTNSQTGYKYVTLGRDRFGCRPKTYNVHRLVAKAFIPNPKNKPEVNHKNLVKTDNRKRNLEWKTYKGNARHAVKNGVLFNPRPKKGEDCPTSRFTWNTVRNIRRLYATGEFTQKELACHFKTNQANIWSIVNNKTWRE